MASPCSGLKCLGDLVSKHMPALIIHEVQVPEHCKHEDYPAMELFCQTDAYEYLLNLHFTTKGAYFQKTMQQLWRNPQGEHRRLVVLWNARFVSCS